MFASIFFRFISLDSVLEKYYEIIGIISPNFASSDDFTHALISIHVCVEQCTRGNRTFAVNLATSNFVGRTNIWNHKMLMQITDGILGTIILVKAGTFTIKYLLEKSLKLSLTKSFVPPEMSSTILSNVYLKLEKIH